MDSMQRLVGIYSFFLWIINTTSLTNVKTYFPFDLDETDFYLTTRKGGPPSAIIEDIRRGQEGVLVKLQQLAKELSDDELKLNNIFYKLGHHDTELKSVNNFVNQLSSTSKHSESKLNKHTYNVQFLTRQLINVQRKVDRQTKEAQRIIGLQKTVDHLEDRLAEAIYRVKYLEDSREFKKTMIPKPKSDIDFITEPLTLLSRPMRDQKACSEGWTLMAKKCLYASAIKQTFHQAVVSCNGMNGNLASLVDIDPTHMEPILSSGNSFWTSATDIFSPHQWTFLLSGRPVRHSMWAETEKRRLNNVSEDHCAIIGPNGLQAVKCTEYKLFICQQP